MTKDWSIESAVAEIVDKMSAGGSNVTDVHGTLYKALAQVLDLYHRVTDDPAVQQQFQKLLTDKKIRVRQDAHPMTPFIKLCFSGRKARDYHRYAGALGYASSQNWDSLQFLKHLRQRGGGGLTELAEMERIARGKTRPAPDGLKLLGRKWQSSNSLASFIHDESASIGPVLLAGKRTTSGEIYVHLVLDNSADQEYANKAFIKLWGTLEKRRQTKSKPKRQPLRRVQPTRKKKRK